MQIAFSNINRYSSTKTNKQAKPVSGHEKQNNTKELSFGSSKSQTVQDVAQALFSHRRPLCDTEPEHAGSVFCRVFEQKIRHFVQQNKPVEFIMAAYPFKSLSRKKCISPHADMAEKASIQYLGAVIDDIQRAYDPGAKLTIYSDGYIFSTVEGNPKLPEARQYSQELKGIVQAQNRDSQIQIKTLEDLFGSNFAEEREKIFANGETIEQIRDRVQTDGILRNDLCGVKRFITEELGGIEDYADLSKNKRDNLAKTLAYQTIRTAEAWSKFLVGRTPEAIRLSCHPQNFDSPSKVGIFLAKGKDNWLTPWMGAAAKTGEEEYTLLQNEQAQNLGLKLIHDENGLPCHYEIPDDISEETKSKILAAIKR